MGFESTLKGHSRFNQLAYRRKNFEITFVPRNHPILGVKQNETADHRVECLVEGGLGMVSSGTGLTQPRQIPDRAASGEQNHQGKQQGDRDNAITLDPPVGQG